MRHQCLQINIINLVTQSRFSIMMLLCQHAQGLKISIIVRYCVLGVEINGYFIFRYFSVHCWLDQNKFFCQYASIYIRIVCDMPIHSIMENAGKLGLRIDFSLYDRVAWIACFIHEHWVNSDRIIQTAFYIYPNVYEIILVTIYCHERLFYVFLAFPDM